MLITIVIMTRVKSCNKIFGTLKLLYSRVLKDKKTFDLVVINQKIQNITQDYNHNEKALNSKTIMQI